MDRAGDCQLTQLGVKSDDQAGFEGDNTIRHALSGPIIRLMRLATGPRGRQPSFLAASTFLAQRRKPPSDRAARLRSFFLRCLYTLGRAIAELRPEITSQPPTPPAGLRAA